MDESDRRCGFVLSLADCLNECRVFEPKKDLSSKTRSFRIVNRRSYKLKISENMFRWQGLETTFHSFSSWKPSINLWTASSILFRAFMLTIMSHRPIAGQVDWSILSTCPAVYYNMHILCRNALIRNLRFYLKLGISSLAALSNFRVL